MFSNVMGWFGRPDPKQAARDAIVVLRQQLELINKKEQFIEKRVQEELQKAKVNSISNKKVALAALRKKKLLESEADQLDGTKMRLEMQIQVLESANLNAQTFAAMKQASEVLKIIHARTPITKAENIMADINDATATHEELNSILSNEFSGPVFDPEELQIELAELEREEMDQRLQQTRQVPIQSLAVEEDLPPVSLATDEDDETTMIKRLQAEMAM